MPRFASGWFSGHLTPEAERDPDEKLHREQGFSLLRNAKQIWTSENSRNSTCILNICAYFESCKILFRGIHLLPFPTNLSPPVLYPRARPQFPVLWLDISFGFFLSLKFLSNPSLNFAISSSWITYKTISSALCWSRPPSLQASLYTLVLAWLRDIFFFVSESFCFSTSNLILWAFPQMPMASYCPWDKMETPYRGLQGRSQTLS